MAETAIGLRAAKTGTVRAEPVVAADSVAEYRDQRGGGGYGYSREGGDRVVRATVAYA